MAAGANHSRLTSITYPNGRNLRYEYTTGLDANISRVSFLADSDLSPHYEEYAYLGVSTIVRRKRPQPNYDLTYIKLAAESVGDAGDQYTGLDRFGRIVDHKWRRDSNATYRDRFAYGYDRLANPLYKENLFNTAKSELLHPSGAASNTAYDKLSRMTEHHIGTLGGGKNTITPADPNTADPVYGSQVFALDALGNWSSVTQDGSAQTRTHNAQNQVTSVSGGAFTPTYDNNGNLTRDHTGKQFVFDAWNALKQVKDSGGAVLVTYTVDALNRRSAAGTTTFFYSSDWQLLEERVSNVPRIQYLWGLGYVDALIRRERDSDNNGSLNQIHYVQYDANWNVTALLSTGGTVQERMLYDAYGSMSFFTSTYGARTVSSYAWIYGFQGGRYDSVSTTYHFRNRELHPVLGRFIQRDPTGYVDGMCLYLAYGSHPFSAVDPLGLDERASTGIPLWEAIKVVLWEGVAKRTPIAPVFYVGNQVYETVEGIPAGQEKYKKVVDNAMKGGKEGAAEAILDAGLVLAADMLPTTKAYEAWSGIDTSRAIFTGDSTPTLGGWDRAARGSEALQQLGNEAAGYAFGTRKPVATPAGKSTGGGRGAGKGIEYPVKRPPGVSDADWQKKLDALNKGAAEGRAKVVHHPERSGEAQKLAHKQGKIAPGHDADHGLDLQFGGRDDIGEIISTEKRVNRSVGAQGKGRMRHPDNTRIDKFVEKK